jgi:hypothetical protein
MDPGADKVCPLLVGACLSAGLPPERDGLCWRVRCQLWHPQRLACGLELLRLEDTLARLVRAEGRG